MLNAHPFEKFRKSPLFAKSREVYPPGWTTQDYVADPQFVKLTANRAEACDLRLSSGGGALDIGVPVPATWPDPLRQSDAGEPDAGVLPLGASAWGVGVDGRIPLFGK
jgi:hypothetical protein